jgi:hypothetical protein
MLRLCTYFNLMYLLLEMNNHFEEAIKQNKGAIQLMKNRDIQNADTIVCQHSFESKKHWNRFVEESNPYYTKVSA